MAIQTIQLDALRKGLTAKQIAETRAWCAHLEAGGILYFPQTPIPIPPSDLQFLLGQQQTGSRVHKNIAYKPGSRPAERSRQEDGDILLTWNNCSP
jgi:hypothetical protein